MTHDSEIRYPGDLAVAAISGEQSRMGKYTENETKLLVKGRIMVQKNQKDRTDEVAARFSEAEFPRLCHMKIENITDDEVRVTMPIEGMKNANGVAHGGAIFSLADQAFGIAANLHGKEVAIMAEMRYISPATGDMTAIARCLSRDGKTSCYLVEVVQGTRLVALFTGTGIRLDENSAGQGS
jgi:acyl-CoA thioesterase